MCGRSDFKVNGKVIGVFLGYRGGNITIDKVRYDLEDLDIEEKEDKIETEEVLNNLKNKLKEFSKENLIDFILEMVKNAEEG
jgi:hypothetical protein